MCIGQKIGIMIIVIVIGLALGCRGLNILKESTISDHAKAGWIVLGLYFGGFMLGLIAKWLDEK